MADKPNVLLRSEQTGGHVALVELTGRGRPRVHRHDFDAAFCVLEGELTFQLGDDIVTCRAGEVAFAPRNVAHTNTAAHPARVLLVITPAGFERYFARVAAERDGIDPPEWALQPIPEVITVGPRLAGDRA
jgi:quercetin dioxygenase-like cupin family protein